MKAFKKLAILITAVLTAVCLTGVIRMTQVMARSINDMER